jgi:hypothetical protein
VFVSSVECHPVVPQVCGRSDTPGTGFTPKYDLRGDGTTARRPAEAIPQRCEGRICNAFKCRARGGVGSGNCIGVDCPRLERPEPGIEQDATTCNATTREASCTRLGRCDGVRRGGLRSRAVGGVGRDPECVGLSVGEPGDDFGGCGRGEHVACLGGEADERRDRVTDDG